MAGKLVEEAIVLGPGGPQDVGLRAPVAEHLCQVPDERQASRPRQGGHGPDAICSCTGRSNEGFASI